MASRRDLRYTADGLRDSLSRSMESAEREQHVQATMLEEVAVALHRVAEAIEEADR